MSAHDSVRRITTELEAIRQRTNKAMGRSAWAHLLLFLGLFLFQAFAPRPPTLTEITWIDPVEPSPPAHPAAVTRGKAVPSKKVAVKNPSPKKESENFKRETPVADLAPDPQKIKAIEDRLSERLSSLQRDAQRRPIDVARLSTPSPVGRPTLAGTSDVERASRRPTDLKRLESSKSNPIALKRRKVRLQKATMPVTAMPDMPVERARSRATETQAQRTLAGAQMTGPVADRDIISYRTPGYPEWAKREAVEGSVMIYFVVLADGRVKENVMVQKTSGFADFDNNAVRAILAWRFEPLTGGTTGEQWGTIKFHYRLSDN